MPLNAYIAELVEIRKTRVAQASACVILTFDYHNTTQAEACATRGSHSGE